MHTTIKGHTISSILSGDGFSVDTLEADRMGRELAAVWADGDYPEQNVDVIRTSFDDQTDVIHDGRPTSATSGCRSTSVDSRSGS
jgi:hypothetical protein